MSLNSVLIELIEKKENNWRDKITEKMSPIVRKNCLPYIKYQNYEDLTQEGYVGLTRALNSFNPSKFTNFVSYADRWIMHYIKRAASRYDIVYNPNRIKVIYGNFIDNDYDPDEIPENKILNAERRNILRSFLKRLKRRESLIIKQSFGIEVEKMTLREIGFNLHISHERVRQIRDRTISKLKKFLSEYEDKK